MRKILLPKLPALLFLILSCKTFAEDENYSYADINQRYTPSSLRVETVKIAKMQGECLVGLKALNFKRAGKFDAIAEWSSYRTVSLLEQYSPCEVLIMMETAKNILAKNPPSHQPIK